jgi:hypothetical protein
MNDPHHAFVERFRTAVVGPVELRQANSEMVFEEKDLKDCSNSLDYFIRMVMIRRKLTRVEFKDLYREWAINHGEHPATIERGFSNNKRALFNGSITIRTFEFLMFKILKYKMEDWVLQLQDVCGNIEIFSLAMGLNMKTTRF